MPDPDAPTRDDGRNGGSPGEPTSTASSIEAELDALVAFIVELNGGDAERARRWLDLPLSDLDGQTARQLVEDGHINGVRDYVESLQSGSVG